MYIVTDKKNITRIDLQNKDISISLYCYNVKYPKNHNSSIRSYGISVAIFDYKTKTFTYVMRYWQQLSHLIIHFQETKEIKIVSMDITHFQDYEFDLYQK